MIAVLLSLMLTLPGTDAKPMPVLPEAVTSFGAVSVDGTIYAYGGHSGMAHHYSTAHHSYSFASLPAGATAWKELAFDVPVQGFGFVAHDRYLYRLGGSQAQNAPDEEEQLISLASVHRYDIQNNKWEPCTPLPEARSSFNAAVVDHHVYVAGGWHMPVEGKREWLPASYRADLRQWPLKWEQIPDLPHPRRAHAAAAVGNLVVLLGGMDDKGTSNAISIFDTTSNTWRSGADFPAAGRMKGFGLAACVVDNDVIANGYDGKLYRYNPEQDKWTDSGATIEKPRFFHVLVATGNEVFSLGGSTKAGHSDSVMALGTIPAKAADNWVGFRNDGRSIARGELPLHWSSDSGIAWRQKVAGFGQSSPVVWAGQVITTSVEGTEQNTFSAQAYDLMDGRLLWKRELPSAQSQKNDFSMARAASSPVVDENGIYAFFPGGMLAGLDHGGEILWKRSLIEDFGKIENRHGLGSSLTQNDDHVFVLVDDQGPSYLLAVNKKDGKTAWRQERTSRRSWTSPVVIDTQDGQQAVVVSSNGSVDAYDARDGKLLWKLDELAGNTIASATPIGDKVLIGAGPMRGGVDASKAAQNNRLLTAGENGEAKTIWMAEKAVAHYASPLAYRNEAYFVNRVGVVNCLDLKTGKSHYAERIAGECWATPIAAGDYIYFFTKSGVTSIVKAGPSFELVATNELFDQPKKSDDGGRAGMRDLDNAVHGVAAADGRILVRTGSELICLKGGPAKRTAGTD